ncbi:HEPN domain-containing protein [Salinibacter ruber]|uniref:HEPN domain-containing protein n=1 Tax=Salinibacter ruber TaxID=146919 RepID=UPI0009D94216
MIPTSASFVALATTFVRTERVSEEIGNILTTARSTEGEADYDAFSDFGREEAAELVEKAHRFIEAAEEQVLSR